MFITDTASRTRTAFWAEQEKRDEQNRKNLEREKSLKIDNVVGSRVDPMAQYGRYMQYEDFEKKLLPLLPERFHIIDHPNRPGMRWLYEDILNPETHQAERLHITAYCKGPLPEKSIHYAKNEIRPVRNAGPISAKDMPKMKRIPAPHLPGGYDFVPVDETAVLPGWEKDTDLGAEHVRGWRTNLLKLISNGAITVTQAERVFGAGDSPEWAGHVGKTRVTTPW